MNQIVKNIMKRKKSKDSILDGMEDDIAFMEGYDDEEEKELETEDMEMMNKGGMCYAEGGEVEDVKEDKKKNLLKKLFAKRMMKR